MVNEWQSDKLGHGGVKRADELSPKVSRNQQMRNSLTTLTSKMSRGDNSEFFNRASQLAETGEYFYDRGWLYGTSGNLSCVLQTDPLRLAITASGADKGHLLKSHIIEVDENAEVVRGIHSPSSETNLHIAIVRNTSAGAVFHTHSVWATILSEEYGSARGIELRNYEMLKGLKGVKTHNHVEWLPILENSQDMSTLSLKVEDLMRKNPLIHGFLLRGHGLYTWGQDMDEGKRHVEVIEFLLEVFGRTKSEWRAQ